LGSGLFAELSQSRAKSGLGLVGFGIGLGWVWVWDWASGRVRLGPVKYIPYAVSKIEKNISELGN